MAEEPRCDARDRGQGACQVCGERVTDEAVRCAACETLHHLNCFVYAKKCSTYGCNCSTCIFVETGRSLDVGMDEERQECRSRMGTDQSSDDVAIPPSTESRKGLPAAKAALETKAAPQGRGDVRGPTEGPDRRISASIGLALILLTALLYHLQAGQNSVFRLFDRSDKTLFVAIRQRDHRFIERIEPGDPEINGCLPGYGTSLQLAIRMGDEKIVDQLIRKRADIDRLNDRGESALSLAVTKGRHDLVEMLLRAGARPDPRWGPEGNGPLHLPAEQGNVAVARSLLDHGARVNDANARGDAPLHLAVEMGDMDMARLLLDRGAKVNAMSGQGEAPLHLAVEQGNIDMARLLLDRGAKVNARNGRGLAPLHIAVKKWDRDFLAFLLERGADAQLKDIHDESDEARLWGGDEVGREILRELLSSKKRSP